MSAEPVRFDIAEAIGAGWRAFTAHLGPMALYALAVLVVNYVLNLLFATPDSVPASVIGAVLTFVVNQLVTIGWLRLALDIVDGRTPSFDRIRASFSIFVPYVIAALVFSIMFSVGMVFLIVPGIVVALVFGFYGWVLVDGARRDPFDALKHSATITRGQRWHLFGLGVVLVLFNILGLLVFVVGVLVTSAISILVVAHVYRRLAEPHMGAGDPDAARDALS